VENFAVAFGGGLAVKEGKRSGGGRSGRKGNAFIVLGELKIVKGRINMREIQIKCSLNTVFLCQKIDCLLLSTAFIIGAKHNRRRVSTCGERSSLALM